VKLLLEKDNIDINQKDKRNGWTALMRASDRGHKEIVKMLIQHKNIQINHKAEGVFEGERVIGWGGEVLSLSFVDGYSTTSVIKKIQAEE
jgi:ankyrin repeat protein